MLKHLLKALFVVFTFSIVFFSLDLVLALTKDKGAALQDPCEAFQLIREKEIASGQLLLNKLLESYNTLPSMGSVIKECSDNPKESNSLKCWLKTTQEEEAKLQKAREKYEKLLSQCKEQVKNGQNPKKEQEILKQEQEDLILSIDLLKSQVSFYENVLKGENLGDEEKEIVRTLEKEAKSALKAAEDKLGILDEQLKQKVSEQDALDSQKRQKAWEKVLLEQGQGHIINFLKKGTLVPYRGRDLKNWPPEGYPNSNYPPKIWPKPGIKPLPWYVKAALWFKEFIFGK
jgi:hypothetical protein